ncbi:insulinase family protein [Lacibacter luteus]|uniref:Insulinase family protein n=1 Tax=Lacibacter luteus TaxID=2508719 RepID=A0A4Q1CMT8_9BACT|nr:M16 family metallopeptidase [Lacibacter luteus]RXK62398.1 insulinase family protein [Lacibacter luteus]
MNRTRLNLSLSIVFLFLFVSTFAQQLTGKLPFDTKVKTGKLENGLTFFIRPNQKPEKRVELRLVVNAGAINEDDDQLGLAHMIEHMAFNGTKNFKKNDIVSYLQEIGVGFGNDLNAYTSFDETVYILPIPTDKAGNLEKGFQILEDWAHNVSNLNEDIDGERDVILEESRLGKGADERMFRKILPGLFAGSLYADRLPIGKDSIIKNFKYDVIRRFYKDWYRPDLMAVIVVGDITVEQAEALIRKHFAGIKNPAMPRERKYASVPPYAANEVMVLTDKEASSAEVSINYPVFKSEATTTVADYRNSIIRSLFTRMLNQRLQELTQKENPPFNFASGGFGSYARGYDAFSIYAGAGTSDVKKTLQALLEEVERVKRFGFTASELERSKKTTESYYERAYNNRDKNESANFVDEYVNYFLKNEPSPGIEYEFAKVKELLPGITIDEVNALVNKYVKAVDNRFTYITQPEPKAGEKLPETKELLAYFSAAEKAEIKPYEDKAVASTLIETKPVAGKVTATKKDAKLGTTELTLSNGIKVTLKPTDFKADQVLMSSVRPGGKNHYGAADKYNAEYAVQVVQSMGVGAFSPTDLRKVLAGKTVQVNPYINNASEGVRGNSTVKDIETLFQLIWLYFTNPRVDTSLFKSFVQRNRSQYAMMSANPQFAFVDTLYSVLYNNDPLAPVALPKAENFNKIDLKRAVEIYKERFSDAGSMEFVFVGSFKEAEIIPLIEQYIGSLPTTTKKFTAVDNKVRTVKGKKEMTVKKGTDERSLIVQFHSGEVPYSQDLEMKAQAATEVLNIRIIEELREKIGGIYGGGIYGGLEREPYNNYSFAVQLPCGPEKADTLLKAVNREIKDIAVKGPSQKNLDKVKQQWREQHKIDLKENEDWLTALTESKFPGNNIDYFINYEKYVDKLTVKDVQLAAAKLLNGPNVFTAIQMPENYVPGEEKKTAERANTILQTIEIDKPEIKIELFDNGEIDGDSVTVYFNSYPVLSKKQLNTQAIVLNVKALKGRKNTLVMFAENLGKTPPNTALMRVTAGGKVYNITVESDTKKNGTIVFKWKE